VSADDVRELLRARGCPESVVSGGLEGLVGDWQAAVEQAERGWSLGLDDWLNELDGRQLVADVLEVASSHERTRATRRLEALDARMRDAGERVERCLWGERVASAHGWNPADEWWYWTLPRHRGQALRDDLGGTHK
jgi:hypothetical protein